MINLTYQTWMMKLKPSMSFDKFGWWVSSAYSYDGHFSLILRQFTEFIIPIINLHVLSIEEEHCCWYQRDVKITRVNGHCVNINNVNISHAGDIMTSLRQLVCQGKRVYCKIEFMQEAQNCPSIICLFPLLTWDEKLKITKFKHIRSWNLAFKGNWSSCP